MCMCRMSYKKIHQLNNYRNFFRRFSDQNQRTFLNRRYLYVGSSIVLSSLLGCGYYYFKYYANQNVNFNRKNKPINEELLNSNISTLIPKNNLFLKNNSINHVEKIKTGESVELPIITTFVPTLKNETILDNTPIVSLQSQNHKNEEKSPENHQEVCSLVLQNEDQIDKEILEKFGNDEIFKESKKLEVVLKENQDLIAKFKEIKLKFESKLGDLNMAYENLCRSSLFDIKGLDELFDENTLKEIKILFDEYNRIKNALNLTISILNESTDQFLDDFNMNQHFLNDDISTILKDSIRTVKLGYSVLDSKSNVMFENLLETLEQLVCSDVISKKSNESLSSIFLKKKIQYLEGLVSRLLNEKLINIKDFSVQLSKIAEKLKLENSTAIENIIEAHKINLKKSNELLQSDYKKKLEQQKIHLTDELNNQHLKEFRDLNDKFHSLKLSYIKIANNIDKQNALNQFFGTLMNFHFSINDGNSFISSFQILEHLNFIVKATHGTRMETVVSILINSIPNDLLLNGAVKRNQLIMDLVTLSNKCKKVALVQSNGSFWQYFVSSMAKKLRISTSTLINESVDVNNPYEIIETAIELCRRNQLQKAIVLLQKLDKNGQPSKLCQQWIRNAIGYLELKFVTDFLMISVQNKLAH